MFECWQDCLHPWDQCAPFLSSFDVANRANFRVWIRLSNEFLIDRIVASKRSEMAGTQRRNWRGRRIVRSPIGRLGYWVLHVSSKQCTMAASFVCVDVVPNENRTHWDAPGYGSRKGHLFTSQPTEVWISQIWSKPAQLSRKPNTSLQESKDLLGHILMVSQVRNIDLKDSLSFSLRDYPPALSCYRGTHSKTDKSSWENIWKILCPSPVIVSQEPGAHGFLTECNNNPSVLHALVSWTNQTSISMPACMILFQMKTDNTYMINLWVFFQKRIYIFKVLTSRN